MVITRAVCSSFLILVEFFFMLALFFSAAVVVDAAAIRDGTYSQEAEANCWPHFSIVLTCTGLDSKHFGFPVS
jgi:hypothetical protein